MYKTVKHGENSLQYTILPQTEEVLTNNGVKGRGRDYSPCLRPHSNKRSYLQSLFCIFFLLIVAAIVALYLYPFHANRWYIDKAIEEAYKKGNAKPSSKNNWRDFDDLEEAPIMKMGVRLRSTPPPRDFRVVFPLSTPPPWSMPALRSWKSAVPLTTPPPIPAVIAHDDIPLITPANDITTKILNLLTPKPSAQEETYIPTSTPNLVTVSDKVKDSTVEEISTVEDISSTAMEKIEKLTVKPKCAEDTTIEPTTADASTQTPNTERSKLEELKDMLFSDDDDVEFKNSLEVDEAFTLPPLKADYPAGVDTDDSDVTVSKTPNSGWYTAKWPFVDTSSYFQWTGYSSGDNLLLPLLVAAVSSATLVFLLAVALKRRKNTFTIEVHAENTTTLSSVDDNTNLLIPENPEENEE